MADDPTKIKQNSVEDIMNEDEINTPIHSSPVTISPLTNTGIPSDLGEPDDYNSPLSSPSVQGEQSVSGDMPAPEADDDTLQNAQDMGMQMNETPEHPQELDIARDIDQGEQAAKNS